MYVFPAADLTTVVNPIKMQEEQAKKRLRDLIEEGLASGPGRRRTKADEKELLAIARGEID